MGCPGEDFGTQGHVLNSREMKSLQQSERTLVLQSFVEIDNLYTGMTGSNFLLQFWFQAAHCHWAACVQSEDVQLLSATELLQTEA